MFAKLYDFFFCKTYPEPVRNHGDKYKKLAESYLNRYCKYDDPFGFFRLAVLIEAGHYRLTKEHYEKIGIDSPGSNQYAQAAVIYLELIEERCTNSTERLSKLIETGRYSPTAKNRHKIARMDNDILGVKRLKNIINPKRSAAKQTAMDPLKSKTVATHSSSKRTSRTTTLEKKASSAVRTPAPALKNRKPVSRSQLNSKFSNEDHYIIKAIKNGLGYFLTSKQSFPKNQQIAKRALDDHFTIRAIENGNLYSCIGLAILLEAKRYNLTNGVCKRIGISYHDGDKYEQIAELYLKAYDAGNSYALFRLAILIERNLFSLTLEICDKTGIKHPGFDKYAQAAVLYIQSIEDGCTDAASRLRVIIEKGLYNLTAEDRNKIEKMDSNLYGVKPLHDTVKEKQLATVDSTSDSNKKPSPAEIATLLVSSNKMSWRDFLALLQVVDVTTPSFEYSSQLDYKKLTVTADTVNLAKGCKINVFGPCTFNVKKWFNHTGKIKATKLGVHGTGKLHVTPEGYMEGIDVVTLALPEQQLDGRVFSNQDFFIGDKNCVPRLTTLGSGGHLDANRYLRIIGDRFWMHGKVTAGAKIEASLDKLFLHQSFPLSNSIVDAPNIEIVAPIVARFCSSMHADKRLAIYSLLDLSLGECNISNNKDIRTLYDFTRGLINFQFPDKIVARFIMDMKNLNMKNILSGENFRILLALSKLCTPGLSAYLMAGSVALNVGSVFQAMAINYNDLREFFSDNWNGCHLKTLNDFQRNMNVKKLIKGLVNVSDLVQCVNTVRGQIAHAAQKPAIEIYPQPANNTELKRSFCDMALDKFFTLAGPFFPTDSKMAIYSNNKWTTTISGSHSETNYFSSSAKGGVLALDQHYSSRYSREGRYRISNHYTQVGGDLDEAGMLRTNSGYLNLNNYRQTDSANVSLKNSKGIIAVEHKITGNAEFFATNSQIMTKNFSQTGGRKLLQGTVYHAENYEGVRGSWNIKNSTIASSKEMRFGQDYKMICQGENVCKAENIHYDSKAQIPGGATTFHADKWFHSTENSEMSGDGSAGIVAENATLKLKTDLNDVKFNIKNLPDPEDIILNRGRYAGKIKVKRSLHVESKKAMVLDDTLDREHSVSVIGDSVHVEKPIENTGSLHLESKKENVELNASGTVGGDIYIKAAKSINNNGQIFEGERIRLESDRDVKNKKGYRDEPAFLGMVLRVERAGEFRSRSGFTILAKGKFENEGSSIKAGGRCDINARQGIENVTADYSEPWFRANIHATGSVTFFSEQHLHNQGNIRSEKTNVFRIQGRITNIATKQLQKGKFDDYTVYDPSVISSRLGNDIKTKDRLVNRGSAITSDKGQNRIFPDRGFDSSPMISRPYISEQWKVSELCGFYRKTYKKYAVDITYSHVSAGEGNTILCKDGAVKGTGTVFMANKGTDVFSKEGTNFPAVAVTVEEHTSSNTWWGGACRKEATKEEGSVINIMADRKNIRVHSYGDFNASGLNMYSNKIEIEAPNINLERRIQNNERTVTTHAPYFELGPFRFSLGGGIDNLTFNVPLAGSIRSLSGPNNNFSYAFNAAKSCYELATLLPKFKIGFQSNSLDHTIFESLNLSDGKKFNPKIGAGLEFKKSHQNWQTLGSGGIYCTILRLKAKNVNVLNAYEINVKEKYTVKCVHYNEAGAVLHANMRFSNFSIGAAYGPKGPSVSVGYGQARNHQTYVINQKIYAKHFHLETVKFTKRNSNTTTDQMSGFTEEMSLKSDRETQETSSFHASVSTDGSFGFHAERQTKSHASKPTGVHAKDASKFYIRGKRVQGKGTYFTTGNQNSRWEQVIEPAPDVSEGFNAGLTVNFKDITQQIFGDSKKDLQKTTRPQIDALPNHYPQTEEQQDALASKNLEQNLRSSSDSETPVASSDAEPNFEKEQSLTEENSNFSIHDGQHSEDTDNSLYFNNLPYSPDSPLTSDVLDFTAVDPLSTPHVEKSKTGADRKNNGSFSLISNAWANNDQPIPDIVQTDNLLGLGPVFAALAKDSLQLFGKKESITHVTNSMSSVPALTRGRIKLDAHPDCGFGRRAFYTNKGVVNDQPGLATVFYEADKSALRSMEYPSKEYYKLLEKHNLKRTYFDYKRAKRLPHFLKHNGYNAILYKYADGAAYAIIDDPNRLLKPRGAYPGPQYISLKPSMTSGVYNKYDRVISLRTIKGIRILGFLGWGYSLFDAGKTIISSDTPVKEALHQSTRLTVSYAAGAKAATLATPFCLKAGCAYYPGAWFIVPACLGSAAVLGSAASIIGMDLARGVLSNKTKFQLPKNDATQKHKLNNSDKKVISDNSSAFFNANKNGQPDRFKDEQKNSSLGRKKTWK